MTKGPGGPSGGPTTDRLNYKGRVADALRGVVRGILDDAAENGLPGNHHFYLTFRTQAPGVEIADHLHAQYPELMTIVLQHSFWGLETTDEGFGVTLSFRKVQERLEIPFAALVHFADPAVQFELHFEALAEGAEAPSAPNVGPGSTGRTAPDFTRQPPASITEMHREGGAAASETKGEAEDAEEGAGSAEVVTLDAFRKKER